MDYDGHGDTILWKIPWTHFPSDSQSGSSFEILKATSAWPMWWDLYNNLAIVDRADKSGHSLGGKTADACYTYCKIRISGKTQQDRSRFS